MYRDDKVNAIHSILKKENPNIKIRDIGFTHIEQYISKHIGIKHMFKIKELYREESTILWQEEECIDLIYNLLTKDL